MHISLDARDEVLCIMNESSDLKRQTLWSGHNEAGGKPC